MMGLGKKFYSFGGLHMEGHFGDGIFNGLIYNQNGIKTYHFRILGSLARNDPTWLQN